MTNLAELESEIERQAVVETLRRHPEWRLVDLQPLMAARGPRARQLRGVTVRDLLVPVDVQRLALARELSGARFDALVLEIISEVSPSWVPASFLRARAGGPRWKLQGSLRRLVEAGSLERSGTTSTTKYRLAQTQPRGRGPVRGQ